MNKLELPSKALALAFTAIGQRVTVTGNVQVKTGRRYLDYSITENVPQTSAVLNKYESGALASETPEHPLIVAMAALEARSTLRAWRAGRIGVPVIIRPHPSGRLLRLLPPAPALKAADLMPLIWQSVQAECTIPGDIVPAAALVCGFPLYPQLIGDDGRCALPRESLTFPQLTLKAMERRASLGAGHPVNVAITALLMEDRHAEREREAWKNPRMLFRGVGTRSAMVSGDLLDGEDSTIRDRIPAFLRGA